MLLALLWTCSVLHAIKAQGFVCYHDSECGEGLDRPVYTVADAYDECCTAPNTVSVLEDAINECLACAVSAGRVSPEVVGLYPPSSLILEVTATGYEAISWFVNGTDMHDFQRVFLENNNKKFILVNTTVDDVGYYEADIQLTDGRVEMLSFVVYTYLAPSILLNNPSESDVIDSQVIVTCTSHGHPLPQLSLYCNDLNTITLSDNVTVGSVGSPSTIAASLQANSSDVTGLQECYCIASSFDGEVDEVVNSSIVLLGAPPTTTILDAASDTIIAPFPITIDCMATGRPVSGITWFLNDIAISNSSIIAINSDVANEFTRLSQLKVTNATYEHHGTYTCTAENYYGETNDSKSYNIRFSPIVSASESEIVLNTNVATMVSMTCTSFSNPLSHIVWIGEGGELCDGPSDDYLLGEAFEDSVFGDYVAFFGDSPDSTKLPQRDHCSITQFNKTTPEGLYNTYSTLTVLNIVESNLTKFVCHGENDIDHDGAYINITFIDAPVVELVVSNLAPTLGDNISLVCTVTDKLFTKLEWSNSDMKLTNNNTLLMDESTITVTDVEMISANVYQSTLNITSINHTLSDTYTCTGYNSVNGASEAAAIVQVQAPPVITAPSSGHVYQPVYNTTVIITCQASGYPAPDMTIALSDTQDNLGTMQDPVMLDNGLQLAQTALTFTADYQDAGSYYCMATNDAGSTNVTFSVDIIPQLIVQDYPVYMVSFVVLGGEVVLTCHASGYQMVSLTWTHDDVALGTDQRISTNETEAVSQGTINITSLLTITNLTLADSGRYSCIASSSNYDNTVARDIVQLMVEAPVTVDITPKSAIHTNSSSTHFSCTGSGNPPPSVTFVGATCIYGEIPANIDVEIGEALEIVGDDPFVVTCSYTQDDTYYNVIAEVVVLETAIIGTYDMFCNASNGAGHRDNDTAILTVQVPPQISIPPEADVISTLVEEDMLVLYCIATGYPAPSITWFMPSGQSYMTTSSITTLQNGLQSVEGKLVISNITVLGTGSYYCNATNEQDSQQIFIAQVDVNVPATVSLLPSDSITYIQGYDNISLTCVGTGKPAPNVTLGGVECTKESVLDEITMVDDRFGIACSSNVVDAGTGIHSVSVELMVIDDAIIGQVEVDCISINDAGSSQASATVTITGPPVIVAQPSDVTVPLNTPVTLTCEAMGYPAPTIEWSSGQANITTGVASNSSQYTTFSQLTIDSFSISDVASYHCIASNKYYPSVTAVARVTLQGIAPEILTNDQSLELAIGQELHITCNSTGLPEPSISWFYTATSMDTMGSGDIIPDLTPEKVSIVPNEYITIYNDGTVDDDGLYYSWSELVVSPVNIPDEGVYYCVAKNNHGIDEAAVLNLTINAPPSITISPWPVPQYQLPTANSLTITCTATGKPAPIVTMGEIECFGSYNELSNNGVSYQCLSPYVQNQQYVVVASMTLTNQISATGDITVTCIADNMVPLSQSQEILIDIEVLRTVMVAPLNQTLNEGSTLTVTCTSTAATTTTIDWLYENNEVSQTIVKSDRQYWDTVEVNWYTLESTLTVVDIDPMDAGQYKCRSTSTLDGQQLIASSEVTIDALNECVLYSNPCVHGKCIDKLDDYFCECINSSFTGKNCDERAPEPPSVEEGPSNSTTAHLLGSFNLTCSANNNPIYQWYKDGQLTYNITEPLLIVDEAQPSDRGEYMCVAVNGAGNSSSDSGLVTIPGIYQYVAIVEANSSNSSFVVSEMATCIVRSDVPYRVNTIIYSVEECYVPVCQNHSGVTSVLITLFESEMPYSYVDLNDALFDKLIELGGNCDQKFGIIQQWRYDGCREEEEVLDGQHNVSIDWPEFNIGSTSRLSCPCGDLAAAYTDELATRECGGSYTLGGEWYSSNTDGCEYNDRNETITFSLCQLTTVGDPSELANEIARITESASLFQRFDFTIASVIMDALVQSEDVASDLTIQDYFIDAMNNLLNTDPSVVRESQGRHQSASRVLNALAVFQEKIDEPNDFQRDQLAVIVAETNVSTFSNQSFQTSFYDGIDSGLIGAELLTDLNDDAMVNQVRGASLLLPNTLLDDAGLSNDETIVRLGYTILLSNSFFPADPHSRLGAAIHEGNLTVGSVVIAATAIGLGNRTGNLSNPAVITFEKPNHVKSNGSNMSVAICVFWDEDKNDWSDEGCNVMSSDSDDVIVCHCYHLTHFGYLLDISPREVVSAPHRHVLEVIGYIGAAVSILCLLITAFSYCANKKLRSVTQGAIVINMCFSLIGVYALYLVAANADSFTSSTAIRGDILCVAVGALLYYFMLVYFMWTAVEAIDLYNKLVKIFNQGTKSFPVYGAIIAWGVPFLLTAVSLGAGYEDYLEYTFFCRPSGLSFYIGFLVPFGLIYLFNWAFFVMIVGSLTRRSLGNGIGYDKSTSHGLNYKKIFIIAMILSINFGLGWVFGLLSTGSFPEPVYLTFVYLFSIFVGVQGVLILILHCFRNPKIREMWSIWFLVVCCCTRPSDIKNTTKSTGTPFNMTPAIGRKKKQTDGLYSTPMNPDFQVGTLDASYEAENTGEPVARGIRRLFSKRSVTTSKSRISRTEMRTSGTMLQHQLIEEDDISLGISLDNEAEFETQAVTVNFVDDGVDDEDQWNKLEKQFTILNESFQEGLDKALEDVSSF